MWTQQEVFDMAVAHLREQGERAVGCMGTCYYQHPSNSELGCALRPHIDAEPDDINREGALALEAAVCGLFDSYPKLKVFEVPNLNSEELLEARMDLLGALQAAHDNASEAALAGYRGMGPEYEDATLLDYWESEWQMIAKRFKLKYTAP